MQARTAATMCIVHVEVGIQASLSNQAEMRESGAPRGSWRSSARTGLSSKSFGRANDASAWAWAALSVASSRRGCCSLAKRSTAPPLSLLGGTLAAAALLASDTRSAVPAHTNRPQQPLACPPINYGQHRAAKTKLLAEFIWQTPAKPTKRVSIPAKQYLIRDLKPSCTFRAAANYLIAWNSCERQRCVKPAAADVHLGPQKAPPQVGCCVDGLCLNARMRGRRFLFHGLSLLRCLCIGAGVRRIQFRTNETQQHELSVLVAPDNPPPHNSTRGAESFHEVAPPATARDDTPRYLNKRALTPSRIRVPMYIHISLLPMGRHHSHTSQHRIYKGT